jgi:hypothetical protein
MLSEEEARQKLSELLPTTNLVRADFVEVSARRSLDVEPVGADAVFPIQIEVQFGEAEGAIIFRITVSVDRPDLSAAATMVLLYSVGNVAEWMNDPMLLRVFGGHIAVPTMIPFARAKIREVTSDMATAPILIGLYRAATLDPLVEMDSTNSA